MSAPRYIDDSVRSFLVKLAAKSPEPAGGAALALAAASAAALVSLSCHSNGQPDIDPVLEACLTRSEELRREVEELIDSDVAAYREVMRALGLPQETPEEQERRRVALDQALTRASEIPLEVAEAGLSLLKLSLDAAGHARSSVLGDLAAAAHLAEAAVKGSVRNAVINLGALSNQAASRDLLGRAAALGTRLDRLARETDQVLHVRGAR